MPNDKGAFMRYAKLQAASKPPAPAFDAGKNPHFPSGSDLAQTHKDNAAREEHAMKGRDVRTLEQAIKSLQDAMNIQGADPITKSHDYFRGYYNGMALGMAAMTGKEAQFMDGEKVRPADFESELSTLLNRYSRENESDTPDFLLARFLEASLNTFGDIVRARDEYSLKDQQAAEQSAELPTFGNQVSVGGPSTDDSYNRERALRLAMDSLGSLAVDSGLVFTTADRFYKYLNGEATLTDTAA